MSNKHKISNGLGFILIFLCLTPILGGIVGIILLIPAIWINKSRFLLIIGIIGVLLTTFEVSYLLYFEKNRGPFDTSRIITAKKWMREILDEIELYKLSNSSYPDSLRQLISSNAHIHLLDPIQQVNPEIDQYFFYKKDSLKYYLFSKGFDGIPFTKDDIMPNLSGINIDKIGLIVDSLK